jgi:hypothetical protein
MADSKTYRVVVPEDTNFDEGWVDAAVPNMMFTYVQRTLEECEFLDGVYWATYLTWIVQEERIIEMATPNGIEFVTIPVGEYGLRP